MKKISAVILAITAVTMISCQRETIDSGALTGEVEFTVTAGIPGGISTYADPVAAFSHNGGAVNVDPDKYDLRYILEVYTKDQPPVRVYRKTVIVPGNFTTTDVTITARLVAKTYDFVFWADFVPEDSGEEGLHYVTDPLTSVSYKEGTALDDLASEAIDAYCHVEEVDLSKNQNISGIKLHRPFGKIRLLATDRITEDAVQSEYPAEAKVDFKNATVPASFNVLTGRTLDGETLQISDLTAATVKENATVNGTDYPDSYLLGNYYIFATDANTGYAMDVTCYDQNNAEIVVRSLSQIPVQENKLTTVIGNFYTGEGTLQIIVEDPFEEPETVIAFDEQSLIDAITSGKPHITMTSDIEVNTPLSFNNPENEVEIDFNGNEISSDLSGIQDIITVSQGTLTLKNGKISTMNYGAVDGGLSATGSGTIIVEDFEYETSGSGLFAADEGTVIIRNSEITARTYCMTSNASHPDHDITVVIENSTLRSSDPVMLNVPSDITIDNCTLIGTMHGAMIRGGNAKISNSTITLEYNDDDYAEIVNFFKNLNWGSGNMANIAALTIGNKSTSAYQYPTNVTLENTKLTLGGAHGVAFPALYAYANQGEGLGVTLTYDESCTFDGNLVYGSDNIVVNGTPVEPNEK